MWGGWGRKIRVTLQKAGVPPDPRPLLPSTGVFGNYRLLLLPHKELGGTVQNLNSGAALWRPSDSEPLLPAVRLLAEELPPCVISEPSLASLSKPITS